MGLRCFHVGGVLEKMILFMKSGRWLLPTSGLSCALSSVLFQEYANRLDPYNSISCRASSENTSGPCGFPYNNAVTLPDSFAMRIATSAVGVVVISPLIGATCSVEYNIAFPDNLTFE